MNIIYLKEMDAKPITYFEKKLNMTKQDILENLTFREIFKNTKQGYYFEFVGLISIGLNILAILPKCYEIEVDQVNNQNLTTIIKVLKKYGKAYENDFSAFDKNEVIEYSHILSLIDFFFRDFCEYGLYFNEKEEYELNGNGEINWLKTIEEETAYLSKDQVFYLDYHTRIEELNEHDYIRQLHKAILNDCYSKIAPLSEILDYPVIDYHVDELIDNDKVDFNIFQIEKEMRTNFSERKLRLLSAMKNYIERVTHDSDENVSFFGIRKFHNVWEAACKKIFNDQYDNSVLFKNIFKKNTTSKWEKSGDKGRMIPDIVFEDETDLYILDAKYYSLNNSTEEKSFPGVQDVAKQFLYEKAFDTHTHKDTYHNAFICPGIKNELFDIINMEIFPGKSIKVIKVNYKDVFEFYLKDKTRIETDILTAITNFV